MSKMLSHKLQGDAVKTAILTGDINEVHKLAASRDLPNLSRQLIPDGATALHIAVILGYADCVTSLIARDDIEPNKQDEALGWPPLMYSITNNHNEVTQILVESGKCHVNCQDHFKQRPLHLEAQSQNDDSTITEWLLKAKAAINAQDAEGMTPFMRAVQSNNIRIAKFLYSKGCLVNLSNLHGKTPLHFAAKICCEDLVSWLVSVKCNVNGVDNKFQTPLMVCVQQRKSSHLVFKVMQYLLEAGSFVNTQDYHGNTPLLLAMDNPGTVKKHHIELLLVSGTDPDIYNRESLSALWQAVYDGPHYPDRLKVIQLLLEANCNLDMSCRGKLLFTSGLSSVYCYENFMSPFEVAMDSGFYGAARMLAYAGCRIKPDMRYDTGVCDVPAELQWFIHFSENPLSLQQSCRLAIRKILGAGPLQNHVRKLPLPERMKNMLLLQDLFVDC